MISCRSTNLSLIMRSNHNLVSLLKNPKNALKKERETNKVTQKLQTNSEEPESIFPRVLYRNSITYSRPSHHLYLQSETTATKIAKHLTNLPDQSKTFVETNPGPGLLTRLLIQSGMTDIRLFEGRREFLNHLEEIVKVHPDRVKLKHADLIRLNKVLFIDSLNGGTRGEEILSGLPVTEWQNDINFRLYGATSSTSFFKQMIEWIVFQYGILALGRCEFYMVLPSIIYFKLTSTKKTGFGYYRKTSILFQILFEYEILDKFPRTDFLPHFVNPRAAASNRERFRNGVKPSKIDPESMYFVKIVPRKDLYQLCPRNQIQELWHFINHFCHCRNNKIIPTFEKLIPGCGYRLLLKFNTETSIRAKPINEFVNLSELPPTTNPAMTLSHRDYYENLNIFTKFGDLQPSELFTLFHELRMLPEYFSCDFLSSLQTALLKFCLRPDKIV